MKKLIEEKLSVDTVLQTVVHRIQEVEHLLQTYKIAVPKTKGALKVTKNKTRYQYYIKTPENPRGTYLGKKSKALIKELCQSYYENKIIGALKIQLHLLRKFASYYSAQNAENTYIKLNEGIKKYATPLIYSEQELSDLWNNSNNNYESLSFPTDMPELLSAAGIRVRSKSEMMIADCLTRNKIPFKYEFPLKANNEIILHPDFICLNSRTHQEFLWEHFGLMDNNEYAVNMVLKDNLYRKLGYFQGQNLIYTFETKSTPITSHTIENIIQKYLQ